MSSLANLCLDILLIVITSGISNEFTCIGNQCSCLNGECSHTCSSNECINKYFICPSSATLCLVNCNGRESCKHAKVVGAAANVVLNCNGTDACSSTQISCGTQDSFPSELSSFFSPNQFTGSISECFINLLSPNAMRFSTISCVGSVADCVVDAYADHAVSQSLFECETDTADGNGCQLNCIERTSCDSMEYLCNSPLCSCGILDQNCANPAINLRKNILSQVPHTTEAYAHDTSTAQYNCIVLENTDIEIRSMSKPERDSTFHYEISGKDVHHQTIPFRYKSTDVESLSASSHDVHHSVYFTEHEEYGNTYDFEWVFNEPNIICWRSDELSAIKIDLFYNKNISFAFTYIYSEDILRKPSGFWMLTAKNNWNLGVTYLENGFLYFDYEHNATLGYPVTMEPTAEHTTSPTPLPTQETIVSPEQTTTNDSPNNGKHPQEANTIQNTMETTTKSLREAEVRESTASSGDHSRDNKENMKLSTGNTDTPIKGLLFGIAVTALCSILCVIGCIVYNKKKQTQRMAAAYASADGLDSDEEDMQMIHRGNQGDIDETEDDDDVNTMHQVHNISDGTSNDIEDMRMASGILDENDLMDDVEYNRIANNNAGDARESQTSLIKKYKTLNPRNILPSGFDRMHRKREREVSESKSISESGIGYIAKSKMIGNGSDDDDQGVSDDESLLARDRDISMDAEYHHVISQQNIEISAMDQEEDVMHRLQVSGGHVRTESNSMTEQSEKMVIDKVMNTAGNRHISQTSLGFEADSILEHYVNQDSTFQTLRNNVNVDKHAKQEEDEVSVSQSMSRLSQSLIIPPIELDKDITDVKTLKSRTTIQSAADSMKKFSEKIANCAAKFGHNPSHTTAKRKGSDMMDDNDDIEDADDEDDDDQFATMVIYKNESTSKIPESQIVQSTTPPPIPMLNAVTVSSQPQSTQTMIVKHNTKPSKSFDTQLSQIQSSHDMLLSDESSDSSDDISNSPKDPIDASDDELISEKKRHKKNLSSVSNKSHHDRRTMIISDDLDIQHLVDIDDSDSDTD